MDVKNQTSLSTTSWLLAIYQLLGGIAGLLLCINLILDTSVIELPILSISIFVILLNSYSIYSGIMIFKDENAGLTHSMVSQSFQVISFSLFGIAFQFYSGLAAKFTWVLTESAFPYLNLGIASWEITVASDAGIRTIGINVVAVALLVLIQMRRKYLQNEHRGKQILQMGT